MKIVLALLLSLPLLAQLPPGVTRVSYPGTARGHEPLYLAATPNGVLFAAPGTFGGGLGVLDEIDTAVGTYAKTIQLLPGGHAMGGITIAADGALWIAGTAYVARFDPATRRLEQRWNSGATSIAAGPDGHIWFTLAHGSVVRLRPDGTFVSNWPAVEGGAKVYGAAFGTDGAFYVSAEGQLVRVTADGERSVFRTATSGRIYPGPGFFWVGGKYEHVFGPDAPVPADVVKMSYTGTIAGTYRVNMAPRGADAQGNLWLRRTEGTDERYAQLTPTGVLTRFAPVPGLMRDSFCNRRLYGGFTELADGRVAMADGFAIFAAPPGTCRWDAPGRDAAITIFDPRVVPVHSVEQLNPVRRRATRH